MRRPLCAAPTGGFPPTAITSFVRRAAPGSMPRDPPLSRPPVRYVCNIKSQCVIVNLSHKLFRMLPKRHVRRLSSAHDMRFWRLLHGKQAVNGARHHVSHTKEKAPRRAPSCAYAFQPCAKQNPPSPQRRRRAENTSVRNRRGGERTSQHNSYIYESDSSKIG